jgi:hypothetical protein
MYLSLSLFHALENNTFRSYRESLTAKIPQNTKKNTARTFHSEYVKKLNFKRRNIEVRIKDVKKEIKAHNHIRGLPGELTSTGGENLLLNLFILCPH